MPYALIEAFHADPLADATLQRMDRHLGLVSYTQGTRRILAQDRAASYLAQLRDHYGERLNVRIVSTFERVQDAISWLEREGREAVMETPSFVVEPDPLAYREPGRVSIMGRQTDRVELRPRGDLTRPTLRREVSPEEFTAEISTITERFANRPLTPRTPAEVQQAIDHYLSGLRDIGSIIPARGVRVHASEEDIREGRLNIDFEPLHPIQRATITREEGGYFEAVMSEEWPTSAAPDMHFDLSRDRDHTVVAIVGSGGAGPVNAPVMISTVEEMERFFGSGTAPVITPPPPRYAAVLAAPKRRLKV